jgi:hypothetical protein
MQRLICAELCESVFRNKEAWKLFRARTSIAILAAAVLLITAGQALAAPTCAGRPATIVGTDEADRILGTMRQDVIVAGGGNDLIRALDGRDWLCGGPGRDEIHAGLLVTSDYSTVARKSSTCP